MIGVLQMEKKILHSNTRQIFQRFLGTAVLAALARGQMLRRVCAVYIFMREMPLGTSRREGRQSQLNLEGRLTFPVKHLLIKPENLV